ncbi:rCG41504 [Rattus norvegicus]|uniref:RCG41504 n=1 Tax=Rattus norvegicus TaxID=10116 RepID=A6IHK5_RAT|nr:rCG41504 [Rattus norvegicus]
MRVCIPFPKESSAEKLNCPLQRKTQERTVGRNSKGPLRS